ncbi:MAG: sodium:solute symporter family protein [Deltaproteobacteria bacterium]|nr:sodium:solute symporter family protein [Deltaproteobacteria bacterium]
MRLTTLDWAVIVGFFVLNVLLGLRYTRRAGQSMNEFFLSGRNVPWWLAGTSMVATTFGADTPLAVAGLVVKHGIAGNWLWWNAVASGMLTVFFFAALWRRAGVMTDVELIELRYGGKPAAGLRAFRAAYLALPVNCIIIGWVNLAMAKIITMTIGLDRVTSVGLCLLLTGAYVSVSGLWGVLVTDLLQFVVKLGMTIVLAVVAVRAAGGIDGILQHIPAERLSIMPPVGAAWMPVSALSVYLGVQWWAAWYPGAEPGGGGYVAQRIFSAKSEREGVYATLWFNVAHYAIRSWPWILTALAACVLYPRIDDAEGSYVRVMIDHLPPSLRGLMMAGFLAAYMSTVATHLNWGASYLVGDLYKRFVVVDASEKHYVRMSRVATVLTMVISAIVSLYLESISGAWKLLLALGAGTGPVLILRWYWWRINAWSEISAMLASLIASMSLQYGLKLNPEDPAQFAQLMMGTLVITTVTWVTVTFVTKPESEETLSAFFLRVRPDGPGWARVARALPPQEKGAPLPVRLRDWVAGCTLVYGALFGIGHIILRRYPSGIALLVVAVLSAVVLARDLRDHSL